MWRDIIKTESAKPAIFYESEYYAGTPAVTVNEYGKGRVWYIACDLEADALERLVKRISDDAGVKYIPHPEGTEVVRRRSGDKRYLMLLNHTDKEKHMSINGVSPITGSRFGGVLAPYGAECIETPPEL